MVETADIPEAPDYYVSSDGGVYRKSNGRKVSVHQNINGTLRVRLTVDGAQKWFQVARVVLGSFVPMPLKTNYYTEEPVRCVVRHLDNDLSNCRLENLRWETRADVSWRLSIPSDLQEVPVIAVNDGLFFANSIEAAKHYGMRCNPTSVLRSCFDQSVVYMWNTWRFATLAEREAWTVLG